jgi:hypothetical protein
MTSPTALRFSPGDASEQPPARSDRVVPRPSDFAAHGDEGTGLGSFADIDDFVVDWQLSLVTGVRV